MGMPIKEFKSICESMGLVWDKANQESRQNIWPCLPTSFVKVKPYGEKKIIYRCLISNGISEDIYITYLSPEVLKAAIAGMALSLYNKLPVMYSNSDTIPVSVNSNQIVVNELGKVFICKNGNCQELPIKTPLQYRYLQSGIGSGSLSFSIYHPDSGSSINEWATVSDVVNNNSQLSFLKSVEIGDFFLCRNGIFWINLDKKLELFYQDLSKKY